MFLVSCCHLCTTQLSFQTQFHWLPSNDDPRKLIYYFSMNSTQILTLMVKSWTVISLCKLTKTSLILVRMNSSLYLCYFCCRYIISLFLETSQWMEQNGNWVFPCSSKLDYSTQAKSQNSFNIQCKYLYTNSKTFYVKSQAISSCILATVKSVWSTPNTDYFPPMLSWIRCHTYSSLSWQPPTFVSSAHIAANEFFFKFFYF